jgi:TPR repeat protein
MSELDGWGQRRIPWRELGSVLCGLLFPMAAFAQAAAPGNAAATSTLTAPTPPAQDAPTGQSDLASTPSTRRVPNALGESVLIESLRDEAVRYELGNGVPRDGARAAASYCEAARLGDIDSQFRLGWMYMNGTGVGVSYSRAAFFFQIAAEQGSEQARNMLRVVGGPSDDIPECMLLPAPATATASPKVMPRPNSESPHRRTSPAWSRRSRPNTASSRRSHWPSSKLSRDSMSLRCRRAAPRG